MDYSNRCFGDEYRCAFVGVTYILWSIKKLFQILSQCIKLMRTQIEIVLICSCNNIDKKKKRDTSRFEWIFQHCSWRICSFVPLRHSIVIHKDCFLAYVNAMWQELKYIFKQRKNYPYVTISFQLTKILIPKQHIKNINFTLKLLINCNLQFHTMTIRHCNCLLFYDPSIDSSHLRFQVIYCTF